MTFLAVKASSIVACVLLVAAQGNPYITKWWSTYEEDEFAPYIDGVCGGDSMDVPVEHVPLVRGSCFVNPLLAPVNFTKTIDNATVSDPCDVVCLVHQLDVYYNNALTYVLFPDSGLDVLECDEYGACAKCPTLPDDFDSFQVLRDSDCFGTNKTVYSSSPVIIEEIANYRELECAAMGSVGWNEARYYIPFQASTFSPEAPTEAPTSPNDASFSAVVDLSIAAVLASSVLLF